MPARPRIRCARASLAAALLLAASEARAAGSGMPWEAPLEKVLESVQGPVAKIVAYRVPSTPRTPGALKGQININADFDETPPEFADYTV